MLWIMSQYISPKDHMKLKIVFDTMVEIILIYAQRSWCKSSLNHAITETAIKEKM